jgi:mannose-6-phosphate isomerase
MLYPFTFHPIFKERVWGGRRLESLYGKDLPVGTPIGESWEITDRPGDESIIANGSLAGQSLQWLMQHHAGEVLGRARPAADGRFPLLCKILDAREKLSLQVHPPAEKALELQGEPKTEMWHIVEAAPGAELFVGLKPGVTRAEFEARIETGQVADCFHRIAVNSGDTMFLPSGRVHAIGTGLVIFEIQQNSDTTYRVFDWNRTGLDGKPRELHVAQSLASIDFSDIEPALVDAHWVEHGPIAVRRVVRHQLFAADLYRALAGTVREFGQKVLRVAAVVEGRVVISGGGVNLDLRAGQFSLIPASLSDVTVTFERDASVLMVESGT